MDYWNSDGSAAEMCGNGIRVFVAHLLRRGWVQLEDGEEVSIATRGGVMPVRRRGDCTPPTWGSGGLPGDRPPSPPAGT